MSEKDKMLAGGKYNALCPGLMKEREETSKLLSRYNRLSPALAPESDDLLRQILGKAGKAATLIPPFYCDYGKNIELGENFFANFHITIQDEALVRIGDNCLLGPNVSIYTACHPTLPDERNTGTEWARPVKIGDNCWIGGSVTILGGVSIGEGCTIGAGSVVVGDVPAWSIAVGNPCRVVKKISPHDK